MKPKWDSIPERYEYIAQDRNGGWYAYLDEPQPNRAGDEWVIENHEYEEYFISLDWDDKNPDWLETLEKRPLPSIKQKGKLLTPEEQFAQAFKQAVKQGMAVQRKLDARKENTPLIHMIINAKSYGPRMFYKDPTVRSQLRYVLKDRKTLHGNVHQYFLRRGRSSFTPYAYYDSFSYETIAWRSAQRGENELPF